MLTRKQLLTIIAHEILARGVDTMTIQHDELERWEEEITLEVTPLSGSFVLVAFDAEKDTDATENELPSMGGAG